MVWKAAMDMEDVATAVGPYLLVAALAFLWALTEVIQTFHSDIRRALRSGWSALLIGVNIACALLVFALVRSITPPPTSPYLLALGIGAGWQALLRTRVNLLQPLTPDDRAVSLSLSDLYNRFQQFCREQIDRSLLSGHASLLDLATHLPVEELERQVRLFAHASAIHTPEQVDEYLARLQTYSTEERKLYLASYLLRQGGYGLLQERLKALGRTGGEGRC